NMIVASQLLNGCASTPDTSSSTVPDAPSLSETLQVQCNQDDMSACFHLGIAHLEGREDENITPNIHTAIPYFDKACTGDLPQACLVLGSAYAHGQGLPKDELRAVQLFEKACN